MRWAIIFLMLFPTFAFGQDLGRINYMETPTLVFPAFAQGRSTGEVYMNNTIFQYGNYPIRYRMTLLGRYDFEKHGIGTSFYTALNQDYYYFRYQLGYSYAIKIGDDMYLQPGVNTNLHQVKYTIAFNSGDPNDTTKVFVGRSALAFDIDAGLSLHYKKLDVYFSLGNILAPEYLYSKNYRTIRFMIRNRFELIDEFGFTPTALIQSRWIDQQNPFNFKDINTYVELELKFDYKERFWLSGNYRYKDYLGFRLGGNYKGVYFFYGVLAQVGQSTALPGGSYYHDVGLGYLWNKN